MLTRDALYKLVWSEPMINVAKQFGVSGSYMARVCETLNVPRPERGYWARLKVGKASPIPPLPPARPHDLLEWSKGSDLSGRPRLVERISGPALKRRSAIPAEGTHDLISGARSHFESGRPVEEGAYLKPYKKLLVDITTSSKSLTAALSLANEILNALQRAGYTAVIGRNRSALDREKLDVSEVPSKHWRYRDVWRPGNPTIVYVGNVAIGLALVEMSESVAMRYVNGKYIRESEYIASKRSRYFADTTWTTTRDIPCGRFRLFAYSINPSVVWLTHWQDTEKTSLRQQISSIVEAMKGIASDLERRNDEAEREFERQQRKWEAEEERRQRSEDKRLTKVALKESADHLGQILRAWSDAANLARFFKGVEAHAENLDTERRIALLSRLDLARKFVGTLDPVEYFLAWKTPSERYRPRYPEETDAGTIQQDDEE